MKNKKEKSDIKIRFVDSNIFINWLKGSKEKIKTDRITQLSGFVLYRIENGEEAITSNLVKEEVAIWLSRYKRSNLSQFLENLTGYVSLRIVEAEYDDQIQAERILGKVPLGYIDCINLAIMNRLNIKEIYSTDKGFDDIEEIERIFEILEKHSEYTEFLEL